MHTYENVDAYEGWSLTKSCISAMIPAFFVPDSIENRCT